MGHKSKKRRQNSPSSYPQMDMNNMGQSSNNIDINSISSMLNNMDINSMSGILKNMDFNQIISMLSNTLTNQTNATPSNPNSEVKVKNEEINSFKDFNPDLQNPQSYPNSFLPPNDPIVMVLNSIKPLLPPDKSKIIDDFIQLIGIKIIIDKVFPPLFQGKSVKEAETKAPESELVENTPPDIKENI